MDPKLNLKSRTDLIDYDYLDKLDEKDKQWLAQFTDEYTNASFKKAKNIHRTKELRKDSYNRNNHRNNDVLTKAKITNRAVPIDGVDENKLYINPEDAIIQILDEQKHAMHGKEEAIITLAKRKQLHKLDFTREYKLYKIGDAENFYPRRRFIRGGMFSLVGGETWVGICNKDTYNILRFDPDRLIFETIEYYYQLVAI